MGLFKGKKPVDNKGIPQENTTDPKPVHPEPRYYTEDEIQRKDGETVQEYNERIPVAVQPVQPGPTHNYLGQPLN
jgi:hypothetical protein